MITSLVPGNVTFSSQMDIPEPIITHIPMLPLDVDLEDKHSTWGGRHQLIEENAALLVETDSKQVGSSSD